MGDGKKMKEPTGECEHIGSMSWAKEVMVEVGKCYGRDKNWNKWKREICTDQKTSVIS